MKDFDVEDERNAVAADVQLNSDAVADRFHQIYEQLTIVHCHNLGVAEMADYLVMSIGILQKEKKKQTKHTKN